MVTGQIEYTSRAFRQDSQEAMRDDIVRGLIELITNSDDVYGLDGGQITVEARDTNNAEFPVSFAVYDSAVGLSREALKLRLTKAGEVNQVFAGGRANRGLLGRGAKDVAAFGFVKFETICDGEFSWLTIDRDGKTELCDESVSVSQVKRDELRLAGGKSGLVATVFVRNEIVRRLPNSSRLFEQLCNNAQLRDLTSRSHVVLNDLRKRGLTRQVQFDAPNYEVRVDKLISIPGFAKPAKLMLGVLETPGKTQASEITPNGILIKSGKTIYQNTMFGRAGHPFANYVCGFVDAEEINDIIRAADELDGSALISRNRDGLISEHPYTRALTGAVLAELDSLLADLETQKGAGSGQGESLTRALNDAGRVARQELNDLLKEIDEANVGVIPFGDAEISLIPETLRLAPGKIGTVTVRVKSGRESEIIVDVLSGEESVSVIGSTRDWRPHSRTELGLVLQNFKISAGAEEGYAKVKVSVGDLVRTLDIVIDSSTRVQTPPEALEFLHDPATIAPGRTRRLILRGPIELTDQEIKLSIDSATHAELVSNTVALRPERGWGWAQAIVNVRAGTQLGEAVVRASAVNGETAQCRLTITESTQLAGMDLKFSIVRGENPTVRALAFSPPGVIEVRVQGDNALNSQVLGTYSEREGKHSKEEAPEARLMLAELISKGLAEYLVERESQAKAAIWAGADAQRYFTRLNELTERFAKYFHAALRP